MGTRDTTNMAYGSRDGVLDRCVAGWPRNIWVLAGDQG